MAAGPFEADLAMPFGVAARSGGAMLIARRLYRPAPAAGAVATYDEVVPLGANYLIVRAYGPGGDGDANSGAAGGAFAREGRPCTPGQSVSVSVPSSTYSTRVYTTFSLAGAVICSAESGLYSSSPGTVAGSIGTIRAAGGSPGQSGTNGGPAGVGSPSGRTGGGAGGESNVRDQLLSSGGGGNANGGDVTDGLFPGGGGGYSGGPTSGRYGGKGYCVTEFWSAKP